MLPDFPEAKKHVRGLLLRELQRRIPQMAPILAGISHTRIHEGRLARLTRADKSSDEISFQLSSAELSLPREQMRRISVEQLMDHVTHLAEQLAGHQAQLLFQTIREATEATGNAVSAARLGEKEAFLEMERRIEMDFDAETLEPKNLVYVMHPSQAKRIKALSEEWEKDPEFIAEQKRIRQTKIEEWRARENRRQLVD